MSLISKKYPQIKIYIFKILAIAIGIIIAYIITEILLRVYNPISLPNKKSIFINYDAKIKIINDKHLQGIDDTIYVTKNVYGFRGGIIKKHHKKKVLFMGGSTTECFYVSDGEDWPSIIGNRLSNMDSTIWTNNAGISGHSTFGHLMMMDYIIKETHPDYIIFMVGINDMYRNDGTTRDKNTSWRYSSNLKYFIFKNSIIAQDIAYIYGIQKAQKVGISDRNIDFGSMKKHDNRSDIYKNIHGKIQPISRDDGFKNRLQKLIDICKESDIKPVFVTQSTILGGIDIFTGKDFSSDIYFNNNPYCSAYGCDSISRNTYRTILKSVAAKNNMPCIDLELLLPKDSRYYYDFIHYTKLGNKKVAEVLYPKIAELVLK